MIVITLSLNFPPREVFACLSLGHWLLWVWLSHPLSNSFAFAWIHFCHLLLNDSVWTTQLHCADISVWFLFPGIESSQVNYLWKEEEKTFPAQHLLQSLVSCCLPLHVQCAGPHPISLAVVLTKEGFPRFHCRTEKYVLFVHKKILLLWNFQAFFPACVQFWAEIEEIWDDPGERRAETSAYTVWIANTLSKYWHLGIL